MRKVKKSTALLNAKPEHYFNLVTGVPIKNLKELAFLLEHMSPWVFEHHVNGHRNDFASWVGNILQEDVLSQELYQTQSNKHMEEVIPKHLVTHYV